MNFKLASIIAISAMVFTGCASVATESDAVSEDDIYGCQELDYLSSPYDGSNDTLWNVEAYESYKSNIEDAFWNAQDSDLLYYSDGLVSEINDVLSAIDDGLTKDEVEYEAEDIDGAVDELASYCSAYVLP